MDLIEAYHAANAILNTIDFNDLFEGFHPYGFALYNSNEIIIDGKAIPYQEDFRGNTSILYKGKYIAIWNMEFDPVDDPEHLAYCLVHEMFHCHQCANHESRYPSDFELLNYPDDVENYINKYNENRYLANAYEQRNIMLLRKFACIRESRYKKYPSMVCQEWKAETLEGMAEYIGLKALRRINADKYNTIVNDYLGKLKVETDLLFDVRRISYFTGTIYFLCLEQFGFSVNNVFDSEQTAYEQNSIDITGITAEILPCDFIPNKYAELVKKKEAKVKEHIQHSKYIESHAFICGYDPMNMFRVGDMVYCSHFVCLNENDEIKTIHSAIALQLAENSNQTVVGYYI
ncbi:MAG: hypothetical protein IJZ85_12505 [Lachnospiraceae bacterium]|nr:hypothetical protein [Lachnospiraceae bacterium]